MSNDLQTNLGYFMMIKYTDQQKNFSTECEIDFGIYRSR